MKPCHGLYADISVDRKQDTISLEKKELFLEYQLYKNGNVRNYTDYFENITNAEGWPYQNDLAVVVETERDEYGDINGYRMDERLLMVQVYFDRPTFDRITRDAKTNFVTKISAIGGTFGLFTGFSIMSAVEIVFFAIKCLLSLVKPFKK